MSDIRCVVGLDFGTTYSGYTCCHVDEGKISTNDDWPGQMGLLKTNTVLQYDSDLQTVESWGFPALARRPNRRAENRNNRKHVAELFKLHLGNLQEELRGELPVNYKQAITDYLHEIGNCIKKTLLRWDGADLFKNVLLVITVPAEYSENSKAIMRECAYNAGLISERYTTKLQFTTEPEAAAVYCMDKSLAEYGLNTSGTTFMIVDCGGGTVDLTTRKFLGENQLGEITERTGDFCGSTFVDKEFIKNLEKRVGKGAVKKLRDNYYGHQQYMVQEFCHHAKLLFTGDDKNFYYEMDLDEVCPTLIQYMSDETKEKLEEDEWLITFDYDTIKSMFDPIVERIIKMIQVQLDNSRKKGSTVSAMFLVGGFSQSIYLQKRIKKAFQDRVGNISVPTSPIAAISRGAAIYGLSISDNLDDTDGVKSIIKSRVLKFTYGIKVLSMFRPGEDPIEKSFLGILIRRFHTIATRGVEAKVDEEFTITDLGPCSSSQTSGEFEIYYTREYEAKFCDDPGMKLLGKFTIDLPDLDRGLDRSVTFKLAFGKMEITATAINDINGQNYQTTFEISAED